MSPDQPPWSVLIWSGNKSFLEGLQDSHVFPRLLSVWMPFLSIKEAAGELLVNCVYSEFVYYRNRWKIPQGLLMC